MSESDYILETDTCTVRLRLFGLDCWDVTWAYDNWLEKFEMALGHFRVMLDLFSGQLLLAHLKWLLELDADAFWAMFAWPPAGFNLWSLIYDLEFPAPFRMAVQKMIDLGEPFFISGATLETGSPPDDVFLQVFGDDLYGLYWNHLVDPAKVIIAEMFARILGNLNPAASIPDWFKNHCFWDWLGITFEIPTQAMLVSWMIGFEPECFGVIAGLRWKMVRFWLVLFGWIAYIILWIVRFIVMIVLLIVWAIVWVINFFWEIILAIKVWIEMNIILPILRLLWPIWQFFLQLKIWILEILLLPIQWLLLIHFIIFNFLWSIKMAIFCFFIWLHDYLWSIYWSIHQFIWDLLWPIIEFLIMIIWFIPYWIMWAWYYVMALIWRPLDGICISIFEWIDENILTPVLESIEPV